jgi:ectoine hydroxylase
MDSACLPFCLTEDERRQFQEHGYLVVPDALDRAMLERLIAAADRIDDRERTASFGRDRLLSVSNILAEDEAIADLIDWPHVFPKVWGILGWNIYVYHTHLDVSPRLQTPPASPVAWHQDSMRVNEEVEGHPRPRLLLDRCPRRRLGQYLAIAGLPSARRARHSE